MPAAWAAARTALGAWNPGGATGSTAPAWPRATDTDSNGRYDNSSSLFCSKDVITRMRAHHHDESEQAKPKSARKSDPRRTSGNAIGIWKEKGRSRRPVYAARLTCL